MAQVRDVAICVGSHSNFCLGRNVVAMYDNIATDSVCMKNLMTRCLDAGALVLHRY